VRTERHHSVRLRGTPIGTIHHHDNEARFEFLDSHWEAPDRGVLGMWFEDNVGKPTRSSMRLPPWFSNLLPEGLLREWIALDRGVSVSRELELLLRVGADLPGAVQVLEDAGFPGSNDPETSQSIISRPSSETETDNWRFSLAGVGLKFSMLRSGDRITLPGHHERGDWIIKMPDPLHAYVPVNEYQTMTLAKLVGIEVPPIELLSRDVIDNLPESAWIGNENTAYAIKRFDRSENGSIHIEDFNQVRGFYPDAKYQGSYETIGALAYRGTDFDSLLEFIRRLVFSFLIGNGDAHLKNWSFIYADGKHAHLSPAYDLVCTAPYAPANEVEDLALKFGGTRRFSGIRRSAFQRLAFKLGVDDAHILDTVTQTCALFVEAWRERNRDPRIKFVDSWVDDHLEDRLRQLVN